MKKVFIPCLIFWIAGCMVTGAQQKFVLDPPHRDYDQIHIALDVQFNFDEGKVFGKEFFTFAPLKNGFDTLRLHSIDQEFGSITRNGKKLKHFLKDSLLHIIMDRKLSPRDTVTLEIVYTAKPSGGLFFFKPGTYNTSTPYQIWSQGQGEDNQHWYPAYDHPDDRLTTEIFATVPENFVVISNGELREKTKTAKKQWRWHWKMDESHVNYLTTLIVGEFEQVTDVIGKTSLDYYMPRQWLPKTSLVFGRTPAMLRFFSEYIFPYPYKRYAQTPVQDFLYGGMENVTATTLNRRLLHTENATPNYSPDDLIAHEFAHQWFGDLLTCNSWEHAWLNEGFATYFNYLFNEHYFGKDFFKAGMYDVYNGYVQSLATEKREDTSANAKMKLPRFRGLWHYNGGASALHMLRFTLGDAVFKQCVQEYVKTYQHKNVVTEDLRHSFEKTSGKDLRVFFDQWIYGYRFPDITTKYKYDPEKKQLTLLVEQHDTMTNAGIYTFQLPVHIITSQGSFDTLLSVTGRMHEWTIAFEQAPQLVVFNYGMPLLCKMNEQFPDNENLPKIAQVADITYRLRMVDRLPLTEASVPVLKRMMLSDTSVFVKIKAIDRLSLVDDSGVHGAILRLCSDTDARVREAAYRHLNKKNCELTPQSFLKAFTLEQNEYVRAAIIFALGTVHDDFPFDSLVHAGNIDAHRNIIRRAVMEVAKNRRTADALGIAKKWVHYDMSTGDMHQLEEAVMDYCEVMFDTRANEVTEIVSNALNNPYFKTRNAALSLAARKKMLTLAGQVQMIAKADRRKVVRRYIDNAVKELVK